MASFTQLIDEFVQSNPYGGVAQDKQTSVAVAADAKRTDLSGNAGQPDFYKVAALEAAGRTAPTGNEVEDDLRSMNSMELFAKYGPEATSLLAGRSGAEQRHLRDTTGNRSTSKRTIDTAVDLGVGFGNLVGGVASLGAGLVSDEAGAAVSGFVDDANQWIGHNLQSQELQDARKANNALRNVSRQQNSEQHARDLKAGDSKLFAGLKQIGRGILSGVGDSIEDPTVFLSDAAQATGSLFGAGPASKVLTGGGRALLSGAERVGVNTSSKLIEKTASLGSKVATPATIGIMEGGGVYQQTVNDIMAMSHEQLLANSPEYAGLLDQGLDPEAARLQIAGTAGREAAAITAPIAAVAGAPVSAMERALLRKGNSSGLIADVLKETFEEGTQGGVSQASSNLAVQRHADQTREVLDGVGEGIGQGALHGGISAGGVRAPVHAASAAVDLARKAAPVTMRGIQTAATVARTGGKAVAATASALGKPLYDHILERADRIIAANEKASPVSEDAAASAVDTANQLVPDLDTSLRQAIDDSAATPAEKEKGYQYLDQLVAGVGFDENELADEAMPEQVRSTLTGSRDRFDAIGRLTDLVSHHADGSAEQLTAAGYLYDMLSRNQDLVENKLVEAINEVEDDHPSLPLLRQFEDAIIKIQNSPKVRDALGRIDRIAEAAKTSGQLDPVPVEALATPQGQQQVRSTLMVAEHSPINVNPETAEQILFHADEGHIQLSPVQRTALRAASLLVRAQQARLDAIEAQGLSTNNDLVTRDVVVHDTGQERSQLSAAGHIKRIVAAARSGENDVAAAHLKDFGLFAEHMQNKVAALNEHLATGTGSSKNQVHYQALTPSRRWMPSITGLWVNPKAPKTVRNAQAIANDAAAIGKLYNDVAGIFPDLKVTPVALVDLDASLVGNADEIAAAHKAGTVAAKPEVKPETRTEPKAEVKPAEKQKAPVAANDDAGGESQLALDLDNAKSDTKAAPKTEAPNTEAPKTRKEEMLAAREFFADIQPGETRITAPYAAEPDYFRYQHMTSDGGLVTGFYTLEGDAITNMSMDTKGGERQAGARTVMAIARELASYHPAARTIEGFRIGGARNNTGDGADFAKVNLDRFRKGKDKVKTEAEVAPEVEPKVEPKVEKTEPETEPAPVEKPAEKSTEKPIEAPAPKPAGPSNPFANLLGAAGDAVAKSRFLDAFRRPREARTRIAGNANPLATITEALKSKDAFESFLGSRLKTEFSEDTAADYAALLAMGDKVRNVLDRRLQEFLAKPERRGSETTRQEALLTKGVLNTYARGKVLNLVEEQDGKLAYNSELLESAVLASFQWMLSADQFKSIKDEQDLSALLGVAELGDVEEQLNLMNSGLTTVEAKRSLARKINAYWGVAPKDGALLSDVEGIGEAMAAELMHALEELGGLETAQVTFTEEHGLSEGAKKTFNLFAPINLGPDNGTSAFPDAIEQAVMTRPERLAHIGEVPQNVPETQLRNPAVKLTAEQKQAIAFEQQVPHYANLTMASFYKAMGIDNVVALLGRGQIETVPMNQTDRLSAEGKNRTIASAFNSMLSLMNQIEARAAAEGKSADQVPVHYEYTFTRVNRMQMLGLNNPQANKLMREAVSPTRSTLDLSQTSSDHYSAFALGLAQALGEKVHTISRADSIARVEALLSGPLAGSVDVLRTWLKDQSKPFTGEQVETIKSGLGKEISAVALHALVEYARFRNASQADKAKFTTSLYVEADGVTNGPINAMQLLTTGMFDTQWFRNIRKGGLFAGVSGLSMNAYRQSGPTEDLYQTATSRLKEIMDSFREEIGSNPDLDGQMHSLSAMMDYLLPDVVYDGIDLSFARGIAKNPLTITIYGSGASGIANKLAKEMSRSFYGKLTQAMQKMGEVEGLTFAEAMFPDAVSKEAAIEQFEGFAGAFNALTRTVVVKGRAGLELVDGHATKDRSIDPATFEMSRTELLNLQQNLLTLMVNPMREAISDTVGSSTLDAADMLRKAIQVQSIVLQGQFKKAVAEALARRRNDPEFGPDDFLSQAELDRIIEGLSPLAPIVDTGRQMTFVAGKESGDVTNHHFGSSLTDGHRTDAFIYGPTDAGVAGIPAMVIGSGDGLMMQVLSTMEGAPDRTLKIFDGMNMPLDRIEEYSRKANEAVYQSWMGNPMAAVTESFATFMQALNTGMLADADQKAMARSLLGPKFENTRIPADVLMNEMQGLQSAIADAALSVEARHRALARAGMSVDQMASAAAPFTQEGELSLDGRNDEEYLAALNRIYAQELDALRKERDIPQPVREQVQVETKAGPRPVGRKLKSGVRVLSHSALGSLAKTLRMPDDRRAVLQDVLKSLATREYTVVMGSPEQIAAYAAETGRTLPDQLPEGKVHGVTVTGDNVVYLFSPSSETLVHELIHAATFDVIARYYAGVDLGPDSEQQGLAIQRIEDLMNQFAGLDVSGETVEIQRAFNNAVETIEGHLMKGERAAAVNEFMAWGLANAALADLGKRTVASKLVQLARSVIDQIKALVWGRRKAPAVADDMFSNLRFNTAVLLQSRQDARSAFDATVLYHSETYGRNDRLVELNKTLMGKIVRHLKARTSNNGKAVSDRRVANQMASILSSTDVALDVAAHGFPMTMQEKTTFQVVVATLKTAVELDGNALAQVQDLYAHVTKTLKVEDFLADPENYDPVARYYAQEKYNVVVGNYKVEKDREGRTSLLPVFLALAITNDEFRQVLAKMELPQSEKRTDRSLDAMLENAGTAVMDRLALSVSGQGSKADNVQAAIDALTRQIQETAEDRASFMETVSKPVGGVIDWASQAVKDGMQKGAEKLFAKAGEVRDGTDNEAVRVLAQAARGIAGIVDERTGSKVAEGVISVMNRIDGWQPMQDFVNDMVGRTESNSGVYDLIKRVRDWVQQRRQQFREHLPSVIAAKFTRELTEDEWTSLYKGLGRTDLAALLDGYTREDLVQILASPDEAEAYIEELEGKIRSLDPDHWQTIQQKTYQLAHWMNTGEPGTHLLRNANAIAALMGLAVKSGRASPSPELTRAVDKLASLYAYAELPEGTRDAITDLARNEVEGMTFLMDYLVGQRKDELDKANASGNAAANYYKGMMPTENARGVSLIVADDKDHADLVARSYVRVGDYEGSNLDSGVSKGYYFAPVSGRAVFNQGLFQNIRRTAYGVDMASGFSHDLTAGRITHPAKVERIWKYGSREQATEPLLPVFDEAGRVMAYERSVDPKQIERLSRNTHLAKLVGIWRGRQLEEEEAHHVNRMVVDRLHEMWEADIKTDPKKQDEYVDLFDVVALKKDAVLDDATKLLPSWILGYGQTKFGDHFYVRKDMLNDALGYRQASVGDLWTGNTRLPSSVVQGARKAVIGIFGNAGYKTMVNAEEILRNVVTDARVTIVVKSVVVPVTNMVANVYQLWGRGVPLHAIASGLPRKTAEVNAYLKSRLRLDEAEAELRAASGDIQGSRRLEAEIQSIQDSHKRLSIYPLIAAGEFSSISDASVSHDDLVLSQGRINEYMEKMVSRLPQSVRTLGRYANVSRDTALFKALQRSVEYGDFLAKAVLYEDLVKRQGMTAHDALARISEEFVNYDRLPGRFRGYLESMGLLWFWNFKIRSTKVALSMIRNNPVHTLLAMGAPTPDFLGTVGLPVEDNFVAVGLDGRLDRSIGPGMGLHAPVLNPWANLVF